MQSLQFIVNFLLLLIVHSILYIIIALRLAVHLCINIYFFCRLHKADNSERDLAVRAAAASIYSTCNFLLSMENLPCCWSLLHTFDPFSIEFLIILVFLLMFLVQLLAYSIHRGLLIWTFETLHLVLQEFIFQFYSSVSCQFYFMLVSSLFSFL